MLKEKITKAAEKSQSFIKDHGKQMAIGAAVAAGTVLAGGILWYTGAAKYAASQLITGGEKLSEHADEIAEVAETVTETIN